MWGYSKDTAFCDPGSGLSPDPGSAGVLLMDFPVFRTVRNIYKSLVYGTLWQQPEWTEAPGSQLGISHNLAYLIFKTTFQGRYH